MSAFENKQIVTSHWPVVNRFGKNHVLKAPSYDMRHGPGRIHKAFNDANIETVDFSAVVMARALILNAIYSGQVNEHAFDDNIEQLSSAIEIMQPVIDSFCESDYWRDGYLQNPETQSIFAPLYASLILQALKKMHSDNPQSLMSLRSFIA